MRPAAGVALDGRYLLRSLIAVGGMGEVWVAHDQALARDVAAKVLKEEFAGDPGFIERFRTEARNSARLSHPNIAQLFDYGEHGGSAYLVMELVIGEPLSDLLAREQVLPPSRVLPILAQTARALHAAHVAGVVHRDVKPGNILLTREGRVKITDFGISLASNQMTLTAAGMVMGTAQYLAPEQALGKPAAPASDIYSLGVVAYEALVGRRPFTGPTAVDIAVAHVNTTVPPIPDTVPREIADLVMRLLAKDPEQRPRSAASLARTLDEMLGATPAAGVPVAAVRTQARSSTAVTAPARAARHQGEAPVGEGRPASVPLPAPSPTGPAGHDQAAGPPSYPPRRELHARRARRPTTAPGATWRRGIGTPLVVLVLLVGFALLGALFADRIWGPGSAGEPPSETPPGSAAAAAVPGTATKPHDVLDGGRPRMGGRMG